jgi:hypothetical protein
MLSFFSKLFLALSLFSLSSMSMEESINKSEEDDIEYIKKILTSFSTIKNGDKIHFSKIDKTFIISPSNWIFRSVGELTAKKTRDDIYSHINTIVKIIQDLKHEDNLKYIFSEEFNNLYERAEKGLNNLFMTYTTLHQKAIIFKEDAKTKKKLIKLAAEHIKDIKITVEEKKKEIAEKSLKEEQNKIQIKNNKIAEEQNKKIIEEKKKIIEENSINLFTELFGNKNFSTEQILFTQENKDKDFFNFYIMVFKENKENRVAININDSFIIFDKNDGYSIRKSWFVPDNVDAIFLSTDPSEWYKLPCNIENKDYMKKICLFIERYKYNKIYTPEEIVSTIKRIFFNNPVKNNRENIDGRIEYYLKYILSKETENNLILVNHKNIVQATFDANSHESLDWWNNDNNHEHYSEYKNCIIGFDKAFAYKKSNIGYGIIDNRYNFYSYKNYANNKTEYINIQNEWFVNEPKKPYLPFIVNLLMANNTLKNSKSAHKNISIPKPLLYKIIEMIYPIEMKRFTSSENK